MWLKKEIEKYQNSEKFNLETKIINITERICERLKELGWSKKDLAKEMNSSQAWITKMLSGDNNFTLRTLIKLSIILDLSLEINFFPKEKSISLNEDSITDYLTIEASGTPVFINFKENTIYSTIKNNITVPKISDELVA